VVVVDGLVVIPSLSTVSITFCTAATCSAVAIPTTLWSFPDSITYGWMDGVREGAMDGGGQ